MYKLEVTADTFDGLYTKLINIVTEWKPNATLPVTEKIEAKTETKAATKTAAAKTTKAKASAVDEDESFDLDDATETEDTEDTPSFTLKDVIAICKANREKALTTLKKYKVKSVQNLKPDSYSKFVADITA